jgi:hypothetical protein
MKTAKIIEIMEIKDVSFQGKDGTDITGKIVTCKVECGGVTGKMPITAWGKGGEKIKPGMTVNVDDRTDKKGNKSFTAKKENNPEMYPPSNYQGGGRSGGGGMSEDDILFITAATLCAGDPTGFDQALEEAKALRLHFKGGAAESKPAADDDCGDVPF